ncbi:PHD and RING finger domain-containing protein 1 [Myotis brandtii]|uniref:PHD and RING finger domain-containing protein 1 n=1 Tax=Myotis brandtii TaxID=109478 RepID=S7MGB6_MYOBR|nr:PHD and RING finger domain-containing protein 1 [Myotis brandtii]
MDEDSLDELVDQSLGPDVHPGLSAATVASDAESSDGDSGGSEDTGSELSEGTDGEEEGEEDGSGSEDSEDDDEDYDDVEVLVAADPQGKLEANGTCHSDDEAESCPICLNTFRDQAVGTPESCAHYFCLDCILEWSKNANSCPVDRTLFKRICIRAQFGGKVLKKVPVENARAGEEEDDPTFCEVCGRSDREDRLLLCDGCDAGYHMECLDPPLQEVPVDEWFCPGCASPGAATSPADADPVTEEEVSLLLVDVVPTASRLRPREGRTRAIARTRQSERVRATVNRNRMSTARSIQHVPRYLMSSLLDETIEAVASGLSTAVYQRPTTPRAPAKRRRKARRRRKVLGRKKTQPRPAVRSRSSGTRSKRRQGRGKKRKGQKLKAAQSEVTARGRIARTLGLRRPTHGACIPSVFRPADPSLGLMRADIGAASLSVFGDPYELDPFDSSEEPSASPASPLSAKRRVLSRSALRSHQPVARPVSMGLSRRSIPAAAPEPDVDVAPVPDLLGSILSGQSLLMMDSSDITIHRDGSLSAKRAAPVSFQRRSVGLSRGGDGPQPPAPSAGLPGSLGSRSQGRSTPSHVPALTSGAAARPDSSATPRPGQAQSPSNVNSPGFKRREDPQVRGVRTPLHRPQQPQEEAWEPGDGGLVVDSQQAPCPEPPPAYTLPEPGFPTADPAQVYGPSLPPALALPSSVPPYAPVSQPTVQFILQGSLPLAGRGAAPSLAPVPTVLTTASEPAGHAAATNNSEERTATPRPATEKAKNEEYLKKLHMQERAVEEVKLAIKPFYQKREVTKEEYKDILRRPCKKICHSKSGEINPVKVGNLVKAYVDKYRHMRRRGGGAQSPAPLGPSRGKGGSSTFESFRINIPGNTAHSSRLSSPGFCHTFQPVDDKAQRKENPAPLFSLRKTKQLKSEIYDPFNPTGSDSSSAGSSPERLGPGLLPSEITRTISIGSPKAPPSQTVRPSPLEPWEDEDRPPRTTFFGSEERMVTCVTVVEPDTLPTTTHRIVELRSPSRSRSRSPSSSRGRETDQRKQASAPGHRQTRSRTRSGSRSGDRSSRSLSPLVGEDQARRPPAKARARRSSSDRSSSHERAKRKKAKDKSRDRKRDSWGRGRRRSRSRSRSGSPGSSSHEHRESRRKKKRRSRSQGRGCSPPSSLERARRPRRPRERSREWPRDRRGSRERRRHRSRSPSPEHRSREHRRPRSREKRSRPGSRSRSPERKPQQPQEEAWEPGDGGLVVDSQQAPCPEPPPAYTLPEPGFPTADPAQVYGPSLPPALALPSSVPPYAPVSQPTVQFILQGSLPLAGRGAAPSLAPVPTVLTTASEPAGHAAATNNSEERTATPRPATEKAKNEEYLKKLHMQERAVEEVKLAIKPFYQKREVTKEEYKDILRKAVQKICHSKSGEINPVKVGNLVKAYVDKYRHMRRHRRPEAGEEPAAEG